MVGPGPRALARTRSTSAGPGTSRARTSVRAAQASVHQAHPRPDLRRDRRVSRQVQGDPDPASEAEAADYVGHDAGLDRRLEPVLLLFVHEMGHVIQLRREGIKASAPMFIPFMGAFITAKSLGQNALAEARVGLAGPILGSLGAVVALEIWHATGNDFWRALAFFGFFINLFNLIPMSPFDGGRAMAAMAPWMWLVGFAVMGAFVFVFPNPFIIIFLLIG